MTVENVFNNWQTSTENWDAAPYEVASPNLVLLRDYLIQRWGGVSLGIHGDRPIRGGESPSSHAFGAALDWRYHHDGNQDIIAQYPFAKWITRTEAIAEVLPFLIESSRELHVQGIHDRGRIWRSDRPGDTEDAAWKAYNTGYGSWLHIETTRGGWSDKTPIVDRLNVAPAPAPAPAPALPIPPFNPEYGAWSLWPFNPNKQMIALGSYGDVVRYLQGVIFHKAGGNIHIGSLFTLYTERRVRDVQQFFGLTVDGQVGRETWALIDALSAT